MRHLLLVSIFSAFMVGCADCGKKPVAPSLLKEGEKCENDDRCETGLCDAAPGFTPVCVRRCGDGCFTTEVCTQLTPSRFACQPDPRKLCQPCMADSDCPYPSDKCLTVNNEKVCGRDCAFDQNCPNGYQCVNGRGVDGVAKPAQCVPVIASCSCLARGDFQQPCQTTNGSGTCLGIKQCDLVTNTVVCDAKMASTETCNGIDDNCNGDTDEGLMGSTCGVGACMRTISACSDGGTSVCTPGPSSQETCNGIDDNCNGTTDDGFDLMTNALHCGQCNHACMLPHATSNCSGATCHVASCDTGYDNCNTMDPDGCEVDLRSDPMHCGSCTNTCTRPNSTATCANSMCQFVCAAGFIDLNGDPVDGCEYQCTVTSSTDLPDLAFTDANCDGIDGEVTNGIFVSPAGDDSAPGTRAAPKLTLAAAMTAVVTTGKRDVYLAQGSYTGPLDILGASGINVAGAYHPTTWRRDFTYEVLVQNGNPALRIDGASNVVVQALKLVGVDGNSTEPTAYGAFIKESTGIKLESLDLRAGNGLPGADGSAGSRGGDGSNGGDGQPGCVQDDRSGNFAASCNAGIFLEACGGVRPIAGTGGGSCGAPAYPGGTGGQPSKQMSLDKTMSVVANGGAGFAAPNGSGSGGAGLPESTTPTGLPYFGGDGAVGSAGSNGGAGTVGTFNSTGFVRSTAGTGGSGTGGKGGGGGGGGAGGWVPWFGDIGNPCQGYGSAGGGGGGGACGGGGGTGGTAGGGSIAIFLYNASVSAQGVVARAGTGGRGGNGGGQGQGGTGGPGGNSPDPEDSGRGTRGGKGGAGGNGGNGGHGGGGAGGSVYGLAKNAGSTWNAISGTSFMIGNAGQGGTSGGNAGPAGAQGVQTTY